VEYYKNNFSIASKLFSGIFEEIIRCKICQKKMYSYHSFYLLNFDTDGYFGKDFNIYKGFEEQKFLVRDNRISCNLCS
jgi:ubiquitin C-terminal hydrolase